VQKRFDAAGKEITEWWVRPGVFDTREWSGDVRAGGVSTERLESLLRLPSVWLRAMPNTPCVVRQGMTVVCGGRGATAEHLDLARRIFSSVGRCAVIEEHYFNAATALSGSGPAYMYLYKRFSLTTGILDSFLNDPPGGFKRNSFQFTTGLTYVLP